MPEDKNIQRGKELCRELAEVISDLSDEDVYRLFDNGELEGVFNAILDPSTLKNHKTFADFFLANKHRAWLLAGIRAAITRSYSFKTTTKTGQVAFVSPSDLQFPDEEGVLILEGKERFVGAIGLYRDGVVKYAIANRDVRPGESIEKDDLAFISIDEYKAIRSSGSLPDGESLDAPVLKLERLLADQVEAEGAYQQLLADYPWMMGMQYRRYDRHKVLDDQNIPDFTGVRLGLDGYRDVFELKPPFLNLTNKDGSWNAAFHNAWQQAENRIDFIERNIDYLYREKGLSFDNPRCHLILGYGLDADATKALRAKARQNTKIIVSTYEALLAYARGTVETIRRLKESEQDD